MELKNIRFYDVMLSDLINGNQQWIQIMKADKSKHPSYGNFEVTAKDLMLFKENFDNKVRGIDIAVDVEHETKNGAVGWFKEMEIRGGTKLYALVEWTQKGLELLQNKAYKYISPDFNFDWVNEYGKKFKDVLNGCALTNRPFYKYGMEAVILSDTVMDEARATKNEINLFSLETSADQGKDKGTNKQSGKGVKKMSELSEKIKAIIETADITDEDLTAKVGEIVGVKKEVSAEIVAEKVEAVKQLSESKSKVELLEKQVKDLNLKLNEDVANKAVDSAINAKKIAPASKAWATKYALSDPDGFKEFVDTAPEVVDTKEVGAGGEGAGAGGEGGEGEKIELTDTEKSLAKQLHVDEFDALNAKRVRMGKSKIEKK